MIYVIQTRYHLEKYETDIGIKLLNTEIDLQSDDLLGEVSRLLIYFKAVNEVPWEGQIKKMNVPIEEVFLKNIVNFL